MVTQDRVSPSGPLASIKGKLVIAQVALGATAGATATGTLGGCKVGDTVDLSPEVNLDTDVSIGWQRVVADDTIVLCLVNVGAAVTVPASTFDVTVQRR